MADLVKLAITACCMIAPAFGATPYQAGVVDTSCNGNSSCKLTFPAVPTGESLTIQHVSCYFQTSGQSAFLDSAYLSRSPEKLGQSDYLLVLPSVNASNGSAVVNSATLFVVPAGSQPFVKAQSSAKIIGNAGGGCFISGTETP